MRVATNMFWLYDHIRVIFRQVKIVTMTIRIVTLSKNIDP